MFLILHKELDRLAINKMKKKKIYIPQQSNNTQKVMHTKILIGAIIITVIIVVIAMTNQ